MKHDPHGLNIGSNEIVQVTLQTPEDSRKLLRDALGFDIIFAEEFKILRPYLGKMSREWAVQIRTKLIQDNTINPLFNKADLFDLDGLLAAYFTEVRSSRFYEKFFVSVEALAQFFIDKNVKSSWLVAAIMEVFHDAQLNLFFDKEARNGRVVVAALRCLMKIMTLTIQIINRVTFTQIAPSEEIVTIRNGQKTPKSPIAN